MQATITSRSHGTDPTAGCDPSPPPPMPPPLPCCCPAAFASTLTTTLMRRKEDLTMPQQHEIIAASTALRGAVATLFVLFAVNGAMSAT